MTETAERPGPFAGTLWVDITDHDRLRAKQLEMLQIDERFAEAWVAAMRALFDEELDDPTHTQKRMLILKAWEKSRKREQHNLHYKYDPRRRNPKLVERDTKRLLAKGRELSAALERRRPTTEAPHPEPAQLAEAPSQPTGDKAFDRQVHELGAMGRPISPPPAKPVRSLDGVNRSSVEMIEGDMKIGDLRFVTDDDIRNHYRGLGLTTEQAQAYVDLLTPSEK